MSMIPNIDQFLLWDLQNISKLIFTFDILIMFYLNKQYNFSNCLFLLTLITNAIIIIIIFKHENL